MNKNNALDFTTCPAPVDAQGTRCGHTQGATPSERHTFGYCYRHYRAIANAFKAQARAQGITDSDELRRYARAKWEDGIAQGKAQAPTKRTRNGKDYSNAIMFALDW